jgi:hypothetical protein
VLAELGVRGPVALISAGWRHDELRDEPVRESVGNEVQNVGIYAGFRLIEREAAELATLYAQKQSALRRVKERYRAAIVPALAACRELYARTHDVGCPWFRQAIVNFQRIDQIFLEESDRLHYRFDAEVQPRRHPLVHAEMERIRGVLEGTDAVLIAGGHVGVLRNRLAFFGMADLLADRRIVAWSAGAMALADRVVLFHDHTTWGVGLAEVLDRGLGLMPGIVFLPHAQERLALEQKENVLIFARRFAPARCVGLQNGAVLRPGFLNVGQHDAAFLLATDGSTPAIGEADASAP